MSQMSLLASIQGTISLETPSVNWNDLTSTNKTFAPILTRRLNFLAEKQAKKKFPWDNGFWIKQISLWGVSFPQIVMNPQIPKSLFENVQMERQTDENTCKFA